MEPLTEAQQQLYDWLVDYIRDHQHAPSIRQMMTAMNLKSPAPVQSRLEHLRNKGYIGWTEGQARTIRILNSHPQGIPIRGAIAATSLVETFPDVEVEYLDLSNLLLKPSHFALKVRGHSMIDALIDDGDIVILQPVNDARTIKNDTIVAAHHQGKATLKYFERKGSKVILKPGNPNRELYPITEVPASEVEVQGVLVGVWRGYGKL
ncbi:MULTISPECIES: transcriptional repressor LexA [Leptolyngbya]|jgi:repressor LexA|uniref:LexA repressor n=2 Tax=Leptolyngbya boryana TaxID=1184 RepID=A0A1Z4J9Z5_LEPBY|nr:MULTISPECIES: transcriptional repressor LexA [Leptolyngbya]BAY53533.1 LexA repressor [Leptolyngbya boryana NIES-2135]MBD1855711.1 repressor LexA [Leptolyngbya sp. FACHB-1624]MBD2366607.1 repressor LexA [Leptolyngbya sp. FACHB-161]MBD2373380.1 repressor LexA [Leptolyngbya sp. FACHB-238]MBD2397779.1 repressor LexA [Leptolyngbya sp. FACHB-239]